MARTLIVTRHAPIVAWLSARGISGEMIASLDDTTLLSLKSGDRVIGPLPFRLAASLVEKGVVYEAIDLELDASGRGRELSVEEMDAAGARLVQYVVRRVDHIDLPDELTVDRQSIQKARHSKNRGAKFPTAALAILLLTIVVLSQSWLFQTLWDTFQPAILNSQPPDPGSPTLSFWGRLLAAARSDQGIRLLIQGGGAFVLLATVAWIVYRLRGRILYATFGIRPVDPRRVLITTVSFPPKDALLEEATRLPLEILGASRSQIERLKKRLEAGDARFGDSTRASLQSQILTVEKLRFGFPWQQPVRAARAHLPVLQHILVIVSKETAGAYDQFTGFLRGRLDAAGFQHVSIMRMRGDVDIEDHDQILASLKAAIELARSKWGVKEEDIVIDCTPGSKVFSIAAAIATINRAVTVAYVNNDGQVATYDGSIALMDIDT
ncbi:CRISPR-associated protein Csx16 [Blastochloris sulfoviridis]|uniref:CRISPR-associated protein Csx16 n=1 Tax=Blastochloris sulfoviridis TaxID=50712 RepID=A0A5M6HQQ6_9HYPH|nr:CRISPR-associated protein Csx16 [Blastochloris sulfoviridis]KAA5598204.1 CRISPR-associated protein Csx16 [Blastochloris sulfoviridis]